MNRQEQLTKVQDCVAEFEERFKKIIISKKKKAGGGHRLSSDSAPFPVSSEFYRGRIPSVMLHKDLQNTLILREMQNNPNFRTGVPADEIYSRQVPRSSKEMTLNFSREEKLLLYDYCVRATGHHAVEDVSFSYTEQEDSSSTGGPSTHKIVTFAEIAAREKSRRKRTRAKEGLPSTPSTRRTYTDELRGMIDTQMTAWEAFLKEKSRSRNKTLKRLQ